MRARIVILALAVCAVSAGTAQAAVKVTLTSSTPRPKVGEAWRWTVTARDGKQGVKARVKLQILLGETVVGCWKKGAMAQCAGKTAGDAIAFKGKRTGVLRFPAESAAAPLTFQAVVTVGKLTRRLRTPLRVQAG